MVGLLYDAGVLFGGGFRDWWLRVRVWNGVIWCHSWLTGSGGGVGAAEEWLTPAEEYLLGASTSFYYRETLSRPQDVKHPLRAG